MIDKLHIEFEMEQSMSPKAKKSALEYFELQVQIRSFYFKDNEEIKIKIIDILDKNFTTINNIKETETGFDVFFRTHNDMNKLYSLFNKHYVVEEKRSKTLTGRDNLRSQKRYRYFQSLSIFNFQKGNKVRIKEEHFTIKAINNNDLVLLRILDGAKKVKSYHLIKDYFELMEQN